MAAIKRETPIYNLNGKQKKYQQKKHIKISFHKLLDKYLSLSEAERRTGTGATPNELYPYGTNKDQPNARKIERIRMTIGIKMFKFLKFDVAVPFFPEDSISLFMVQLSDWDAKLPGATASQKTFVVEIIASVSSSKIALSVEISMDIIS